MGADGLYRAAGAAPPGALARDGTVAFALGVILLVAASRV
jgi:hypothetical protein